MTLGESSSPSLRKLDHTMLFYVHSSHDFYPLSFVTTESVSVSIPVFILISVSTKQYDTSIAVKEYLPSPTGSKDVTSTVRNRLISAS